LRKGTHPITLHESRNVAMNEQTIFATALAKKDPQERQAFLAEVCGTDAALRAQVERLLTAGEGADSFLEHPPVGMGSTSDDAPHHRDTVGYDERSGSLPFLEACNKPDRIGKLGVYEIIEVVGQGGMGSVLRALDTKLSRVVAVKVMAPELAANPTAVKRFLREAQSAAAVVHDHVVTIHAVDDQSRPPYLVMEFIQGQTLQQKIDREGSLPLKQILRIGSQMAAGLAAAHKTGLIHRDVKPANILLENGVQRVKITDFGLARAADDVEMTKTGMIAGTPQYMSPEQAHGQSIDTRSDLFSLGSVLYTMCTGRPPFRADSTMATLRRVCDATPRPIREINAEIPDWLCTTIDKLLAKRPEDRFQTATEVNDLLSQFLAHLQQPSTMPLPVLPSLAGIAPPSPDSPSKVQHVSPRQSSSALAIVAAIILAVLVLPCLALLLLVGASFFLYSSRTVNYPTAESPQSSFHEPITSSDVTMPTESLEDQTFKEQTSKMGWLRLFNGRDLTGWETHPDEQGSWRVQDGAIEADGAPGYLFTKRDDFRDFHLRLEVSINAGGDSGVLFRAPFVRSTKDGLPGYEAQIQAGSPSSPGWTTGAIGRVRPGKGWELLQSAQMGLNQNSWFPLEIVVRGNHIQTKLGDGTTVAEFNDLDRAFSSGRIVLQQSTPATRVRFRNIEIKELPPIAGFAVAPFDSAKATAYQKESAASLGVQAEYTNSLGMKLKLIPPGEFMMGETQEAADHLVRSLEQGRAGEYELFVARMSSPQHQVRITQPFYVGAHEVTVGQYRKFIEKTKYVGTIEQLGVKNRFKWTSSAVEPNAEQRAVIGVSWDDAKAFCKWLSQEEGVTYDLPTEAQWEYACRAGTTTAWSFGDEASGLSNHAVQGRPSIWPAEVVGSKTPNPFGLFDMHGNADEWCRDWHLRDFYAKSPLEDPICLTDPKEKTSGRVARGGASVSAPWWTRSTTRAYDSPAAPNNPKGFRVVLLRPESVAWTQIFNGKDLSGWKTLPDQPGQWKVKEGVLVGSGEPANLFSERGDYQNFHLRLEAKVTAGEDSGVFFRVPFQQLSGTAAYEAQIIGSTENSFNTGSLRGNEKGEVSDSLTKPDEWCTMEVLAEGDHLTIKVNGKTTVDYRDSKREFTSGHIALQHLEPAGEIQFRKIEIRELPAK
jgi:serine/threonine protein kinase/formylglycine-generating enzyme required for sulfatase activity